MKHKLLLLVALFMGMFVSAAAADALAEGFYRFKSPRSSRYLQEKDSKLALPSSATGISKGNLAEIWEVRKATDDTYVIICTATGGMVQPQAKTETDHATSTTQAGLFYIKKSGTKYVISSSADFSGNTCWHENARNMVVVWNSTESNSQWTATKVTGDDLAAAEAAKPAYDKAVTKAINDVSRLSLIDAGGLFRLKSRYGHYATENASTHKMSGVAKAANDLKQIWIIDKSSGGYIIRNANSGRYLPTEAGADAAWVTVEGATTQYIKSSAYSAEYFTISWKDDFSGTNCMHENKSANVVKWYANDSKNANQYSDWSIEPIDEADTEVTEAAVRDHMAKNMGIATTLTTGAYRLVPAAYPTRALAEDTNAKDVITASANDSYSQVWNLIVSDDGKKVVMQNIISGNYVRNNATTSARFKTVAANSGCEFTIGRSESRWESLFNFRGSNQGFHCAESDAYAVVGWTETAAASQWLIYPVTVDEKELEECRAEIEQAADLQKNAATYNTKLQKYFEDYACSTIRAEYATMTADDLRAAMTADEIPSVLQDMAVRVLTDTWNSTAKKNGYEKSFRINDYQIYSDRSVWQKITGVGPFAILTNPTGIQGKSGDFVYIFVDESPKTDATLQAQLAFDTNYTVAASLDLKKGLNVWQLPSDGEVFIGYFCTKSNRMLADFPKIKIHIEGATSNGYWDLSRGMTDTDWTYLSKNYFKGEFLHVKGIHTVLNLRLEDVKSATKVTGIMKGWDQCFMGLQKMIGHDGQWDGRYDPVVNPRMSYKGNPNWGGQGGSNHPSLTSGYLFNYQNFVNGNVWEILHEEGHGHQYCVNVAGQTECSNNSLAQMVSYEFGRNYSRGNGTDKLVQLFNYNNEIGNYDTEVHGWSWLDYCRYAKPHYDASLHTANHLLYQLYLYFEVMGHMPGFMGRLHDELRANPLSKGSSVASPTYYYNDYFRLAEACAKVSKTDLWEFFETYGFWHYYDEVVSTDEKDDDATAKSKGIRLVGDYGNYYMKMPVRGNAADEKRIADLKEFMHSMPNKASNILFLDDRIEKDYVREDSYLAVLEPSYVGQELLVYWKLDKIGDYGMYWYFDGKDRTANLHYTVGTTTASQSYPTDSAGPYTVKGKKVTMTGDGILGVKIYDADGKLAYIANTKTFIIPDAMAAGLKDGSYVLKVAATAGLDIAFDTEGNPIIPEGVSSINADFGATAPAYDLQGRTVRHSAGHGLMIQGGKKVLR